MFINTNIIIFPADYHLHVDANGILVRVDRQSGNVQLLTDVTAAGESDALLTHQHILVGCYI